MMFAPYDVVGGLIPGRYTRLWSPTSIRRLGINGPYDRHLDGRRLATVTALEPSSVGQDQVGFVFNFFDELRRIAPQKK